MNNQNSCGIGGCIACDIQNVNVYYDQSQVLKDISLRIQPCKVTALLGPSGCGKSTILNCLNRLTEIQTNCRIEGNVQWSDMPVYPICKDSLLLRKRVGYIAQQPNPFPTSIRKNFHIPLKEHGMSDYQAREERMQYCLNEVGLFDEVKDRLDHPATKLSGGQQQRLCIARALSLQPAALLMDEPTSSLDPVATKKIEELIDKLNGTYTIVLVTHNIAQAKRVADYLAVFWMENGIGCCLEHGKRDDVFHNPQNPLTRAYLGGDQG